MGEDGYTLASWKGRGVLFATVLASGLTFLISSEISIALPVIQAQFDVALSGIQWVYNSFVLTLSSLILVAGSLGDRYGRKRVFLAGIAVFSFGLLLSALSQTIVQLILFQALTGVGAAMMVPGSLAIINSCFAEGHKGRVIGLWAGISGGIAVLGPYLGGVLVELLGWQAVFWSNIPLGLLTLLVAWKYVPESMKHVTGKLDWKGTVLVLVSLLSLSFGLIQGPVFGWGSPVVVGSLVVSVLALLAFVAVEKRVSNPIVPLEMFRNPLVTAANVATLLLYFALNGLMFFLVLNLQQIQGFSPQTAGLMLLPPIVIIALFSGPAGSLADRIGPRRQMIAGPVVVGLGMVYLMFAGLDVNYYTEILPGLVLFGSGMALVIAPLTKSALAVREEFSGVASGVNNAMARLSALLAVAILGAVVLSVFTVSLNEAVEAGPLDAEDREKVLSQADRLGGVEVPESISGAERRDAERAVKRSFVDGFRTAMGVSAFLAFLAGLVAFFMIENPPRVE